MTVIITEIVIYKRCKTTLFLCDIKITSVMSWTSIFTSQMTMISNFIRFNTLLTKSTNIIFSIIFFIFLSYNNIFISVFKREGHFIFNLIPSSTTHLHYHILNEIHNNHFLRRRQIQMLYNNHWIQDFNYKH